MKKQYIMISMLGKMQMLQLLLVVEYIMNVKQNQHITEYIHSILNQVLMLNILKNIMQMDYMIIINI